MPLPVRWRYRLDRWLGQFGRMFSSEPKQSRPRLCPACGTLVGATATSCHQCGANMTYSFSAASRALSTWLPQTSPVTYSMLTICCLMYVLSLVITLKFYGGMGLGGGLMNLGGISPEKLNQLGQSLPLRDDLAEPWRLITAIFLHGNLMHIGFNMWVLMDIGPMVEELYGSARYFFLFIVTGTFGFVVSSYFGYHSVGASGSLLGLIGLLLAATTGRRSMAAQALRSALIRWLVYIAVIGIFMRGSTDNAAHAGGFVAGYLLGRVFVDRTPADVTERRRADLLGWIAGFAVAASFGLMIFNYLQSS